MRKLVFGTNLTIDGCCDHAKMDGNDAIHEYFADLMRQADTIVYGRKTYELMFPFWPDVAKNNTGEDKAMNDFAQAFAAIDNVVVCSRSLDKVEGENTTIIRSDLESEIRKLKQQPGKNISTGGVDIPSQLMALGLVDELHIVIQPIVAGAGRRLFDDMILPENLNFKLIGSKVLASGCVALRYDKQV